MKKEKFDVQGMSCSSCQAHVERAVKKLDGVFEVNVNLLSNSMVVEFDEGKLSCDAIIQAVLEAGFGAKRFEETKDTHAEKIDDNIRMMKKRLILSFVFLIPLMVTAMWNMKEFSSVGVVLQVLLLIPIVVLNRNYFVNGFRRIFKGVPNMDSLIAIGSTAATFYGFFESAGMILTLITVGKFLETRSKGKTNEAITKLVNLVPKTASVIRDGEEVEVIVDEICEDEVVLLRPGSSVPVDGVIVLGESALDESSITGESVPVDKCVGDYVISGTVNMNGFLKIRATRVGENTTLAQIVKLVDEASNSKAPISKLADRVSGIFVPVVILVSILTVLVWLFVGQSFEFALSAGIAVLVISCPCALGLAVPVAIMIGTGKGAENGVLIKSAESLERLHEIDTVVLDKTGTITEGRPKVIGVNAFDGMTDEIIMYAATLEKKSEHPLALAILEYADKLDVKMCANDVEKFKAVSGIGVEGYINGEKFSLGKQGESSLVYPSEATVLFLAKEDKILGTIAVKDTVKNSSVDAVKGFKEMNLEVAMLTGDNETVANSIAKEVGINKVFADVLPQDKERIVREFQDKGKKVLFVGDGINDSPALVRADVGVAIGRGTDIATLSADVVLMKDSLRDVVVALELGKAVMRKIRQNLFWAFFYNVIGIPVAAGVLYPLWGITLNPMIGAAAMSLSSVTVVSNALLLRRFKSKYFNDLNS